MQNRSSTVVLLLLTAVLFGISPLVVLITDGMWFGSIGYDAVFLRMLAVRFGAGLGVGLLAAFAVWLSASHALRHTRGISPLSPELASNPLGRALTGAQAGRLLTTVALGFGLMFGMQGSGLWEQLLLFAHRQPFGFEDPVMGLDAGFFVFVLPLLLSLRSLALGITVVSALVAGVIYLLRGGIRVQLAEVDGQLVARGLEMGPPVRRHFGALAATALLLLAIGTYLHRYTLMYDQDGLVAGPGYADVHGTLPLLTLQAVATAIAAFLAWVGFERLKAAPLLGAATLVMVFSAVTSLYPNLLQRFSVLPNEITREAPYMQAHIAATRAAWDLEAVEERRLSGDATLTYQDIEDNAATIRNVRLWDHEPLLDTFSQVQEIRTYYGFVSVDNDRYVIDGELRQIMLSPRELIGRDLPAQAQTWVNQRMTYTHGYGIALGPVNEVTPQGLPSLFIQDLPPRVKFEDDLGVERPELYFGEAMESWVLVNTETPEFDYPAGDENKYTRYAGEGGIRLGTFGRYLFALRFGSTELLFTGDLTPDSRVLLYRRIQERVSKIAPFLRLDNDPYLVIDQGRLVWMVDAYTQTSRFPYSRSISRRSAVNYMRNSVKATVDAYDGTVNFYVFDDSDPIVAAWAAAFPTLFRPASEMPASLRAHVRYPQDYFAIQAHMFSTYHMEEHQIWYNREDEWEVPTVAGRRMSPYYTVMKLPGEEREEFILMLPFNPAQKVNLSAWMVARSDGDRYGQLRVYKFPKEKMVYGPNMIVARINQDDEISQNVSLWNQQGSQVLYGTLLVIPVEESLLYVQPLYIRADNDSIPELKRVIVAYENEITMAPTLEAGLRQIFSVPDVKPPSRAPVRPVASAPGAGEGEAIELSGELASLAAQAAEQWDRANAAAKDGDWARYGQAIEQLGRAIEAMRGLQQEPPVAEGP